MREGVWGLVVSKVIAMVTWAMGVLWSTDHTGHKRGGEGERGEVMPHLESRARDGRWEQMSLPAANMEDTEKTTRRILLKIHLHTLLVCKKISAIFLRLFCRFNCIWVKFQARSTLLWFCRHWFEAIFLCCKFSWTSEKFQVNLNDLRWWVWLVCSQIATWAEKVQ